MTRDEGERAAGVAIRRQRDTLPMGRPVSAAAGSPSWFWESPVLQAVGGSRQSIHGLSLY